MSLVANLQNPMIWIDVELTGKDISKDQIIEIAVIVSDGNNLDK